MSDSTAARVVMLMVLVAALVSPVINVVMKGAPGAAVFAIADFPWTRLLPVFRNDYLTGIGVSFGLFWPLLLAGIFIIALNRRIPEKRQAAPGLYRLGWLTLSTLAMSVVLALPFHLYGLWMTHREYGAWTALPIIS